MPMKPPRICGCGIVVSAGVQCACQIERKRLRNERFEATRPSARERGYNRSWEKERAIYLKANPLCRRCGATAHVVDHIQPHKGNQALFWNKANWQPLCTPCHSRAKQAADRRQELKP